jgi:hypothetical protein
MMDKPKPMSATAHAVLALAATSDDHLVHLPRLPVAAARQVIRSMLNAGLIEELPAATVDLAHVWRTGQHGEVLALRATALGLARVAEGASAAIAASVPIGTAGEAAAEAILAIGIRTDSPSTTVTPPPEDLPADAPQAGSGVQARLDPTNRGTSPASAQTTKVVQEPSIALQPAGRRVSLRQAAEALLDAWNGLAGSKHTVIDALAGPIDGLRAALATRTLVSAKIDPPWTPKDTKHAQVLAMLRRVEGASGPQIAEAMGWAPHTVRGFLAGLAKKGLAVSVLKRVRQLGPDKAGAKVSYTVYCLSDEPQT